MKMFWNYVFINVLFLSLFVLFVAADDDEEMCECILLGITDDVLSCSGWEDAPVKVEMSMTMKEGDGDKPDLVTLEGKIDSDDEISSGYNINININSDTPNGKELVWSGGAEVCKSMSDTDAPWFPLLKPFNTTECPIVKDSYKVEGLYLTLDFLDGLVTKDFIGSYLLGITIEHAADKIMCFEMGAEIYQEDRACKYCPGADKAERK